MLDFSNSIEFGHDAIEISPFVVLQPCLNGARVSDIDVAERAFNGVFLSGAKTVEFLAEHGVVLGIHDHILDLLLSSFLTSVAAALGRLVLHFDC